MTYDELLIKIYTIHNNSSDPGMDRTKQYDGMLSFMKSIIAVVELHKPVMAFTGGYDGEENELWEEQCKECSGNRFSQMYPCPTIQSIEKELA